jgi:hypothetical protein
VEGPAPAPPLAGCPTHRASPHISRPAGSSIDQEVPAEYQEVRLVMDELGSPRGAPHHPKHSPSSVKRTRCPIQSDALVSPSPGPSPHPRMLFVRLTHTTYASRSSFVRLTHHAIHASLSSLCLCGPHPAVLYLPMMCVICGCACLPGRLASSLLSAAFACASSPAPARQLFCPPSESQK